MKTLKDMKDWKCIPYVDAIEDIEKLVKDRIKELEEENKIQYEMNTIPNEVHRSICRVNRAIIAELKNLLGEEPKQCADKLMVKTVHTDAVTKID